MAVPVLQKVFKEVKRNVLLEHWTPTPNDDAGWESTPERNYSFPRSKLC